MTTEEIQAEIARITAVLKKPGLHNVVRLMLHEDRKRYRSELADLFAEEVRQEVHAEQRCDGCGSTKAECDGYKQQHKVCCPDCKHRQARVEVTSS